MSEPTSEQAVIRQVLQGHKEAFAYIVDQYKHKIYGILRGMGAGHQDAQDLTQDTFIKAYRKLGLHRQDRSFAAWIYTIALNLWRDHHRQRSAHMVDQLPDGPQDEMTPEDYYLRKEMQLEVQRKLHTLPEDYRLVLLLRYTNELSYEEIGELTGMPPNKVRNCLHRAKKGLHKQLKNEEGMRYELLEP